MATVLTPDQKLEGLKILILETFEELSNYLSVHKQKLLSRLIRIKEGYDKNTELNAAIKQLRSVKENALKIIKSNLLESIVKDFDNRSRIMENCKVEVEDLDLVSFRCYSDKIRKSIDEIDLIEHIPEYVGKEHPILSKCRVGVGKGKFKNPRGIAFDKIRHKLYICDSSNCRIQVFNTNGKFLHSFGNDQLHRPLTICLSNEFVFISDEVKNCVTKFTLEGMFIKSFDGGAVKFSRNYGVDCCDEFLYICAFRYQRIYVLDLNLNSIKQFGSGEIKYPIDVTIHYDRLYILSRSISSIYCYNKECTFLKEIQLSGGDIPMTLALFMVIDPKGNFLISDGSNQEVRIFSPQGILKHIVGRGHFNLLNGLALDHSNNIICVNHGTGSDCFQKY